MALLRLGAFSNGISPILSTFILGFSLRRMIIAWPPINDYRRVAWLAKSIVRHGNKMQLVMFTGLPPRLLEVVHQYQLEFPAVFLGHDRQHFGNFFGTIRLLQVLHKQEAAAAGAGALNSLNRF